MQKMLLKGYTFLDISGLPMQTANNPDSLFYLILFHDLNVYKKFKQKL